MGKAPWKRAFEKGLERDVVIWWVEKERTFHAESGKKQKVPFKPPGARWKSCNLYILTGNFYNSEAIMQTDFCIFFLKIYIFLSDILSKISGDLENSLESLLNNSFSYILMLVCFEFK